MGVLILGHNPVCVQQAIRRQISLGTSFGTTTKSEIELSRLIIKKNPSIKKVRFVNSGTEATMSAIRLARGFTGKTKIVKFDGGYHGHFDDLLITAGSGVTSLKKSSSQGIPASHISNTFTLPFNNTRKVAEVVEKYHKDIAGIIVEPVAGNMGVVLPTKDFLPFLRKITRKYKIILIFDEVMTGFRSNPAGAQGEWGIGPDLTCLGKIIGGGFPIGAYGGRKDIMDKLALSGGVYQAGTFSGNPIVMQAGIATLKGLTASVYKALNRLCEDFSSQMNSYFHENRIAAHFSAYHSMMSIRFSNHDARDYEEVRKASDGRKYSRLFWTFLIAQGIYWPPAELETFFVSAKHSQRDLQVLAQAVKQFF